MRVSNAAETLLAQHHLVRVAHAIELLPAEKRETPRYIYTHTHTHTKAHTHTRKHMHASLDRSRQLFRGSVTRFGKRGLG